MISIEEYKVVAFKADVPIKCDRCNKTFIKSKRNIHKHVCHGYKMFCSKECRSEIIIYTCAHCNNECRRTRAQYAEQIYCSTSCSNSATKKGVKRSKEACEKISKGLLKRSGRETPKYPLKKVDVSNKCNTCGKSIKTKWRRRFCSAECRLASYKACNNALYSYRFKCLFKFNVYDYPDKFNLSLIEQHGWYKAKNRGDNLFGVSRDHMYSVKDGFLNGIDPKILSHPANCQLLPHSNNSSKYSKSDISLNDLLTRIKEW